MYQNYPCGSTSRNRPLKLDILGGPLVPDRRINCSWKRGNEPPHSMTGETEAVSEGERSTILKVPTFFSLLLS